MTKLCVSESKPPTKLEILWMEKDVQDRALSALLAVRQVMLFEVDWRDRNCIEAINDSIAELSRPSP